MFLKYSFYIHWVMHLIILLELQNIIFKNSWGKDTLLCELNSIVLLFCYKVGPIFILLSFCFLLWEQILCILYCLIFNKNIPLAFPCLWIFLFLLCSWRRVLSLTVLFYHLKNVKSRSWKSSPQEEKCNYGDRC